MMPTLRVTHDLDKVAAEYGLMAEEQALAAARALNRTMPSVRALAARRLQREEYPGIKIGTLKGRMQIVRATRNEPRAALVFTAGRFSLYGNFGMRAEGRWGVRFSKLPWRLETVTGEPVSAAMLARAFRQRTRRGGRAWVFSRETAARLSFEILYAPGLARAVAERPVGDQLPARALEIFSADFEREAHYRIWKRA